MKTFIAVMPLVYLAVMAIPLITIDIREHRLPNKIILPFIFTSLITDIVASFVSGEWWRLGLALAVAFGIGIAGIVANYFDLIGMGDIKLFFGSSLVIGWFVWWLPIVLVIGTLVIGIVATLYVLVFRKAKAGTSVPLGPYAIVLSLVIGTYGVMSIQEVSLSPLSQKVRGIFACQKKKNDLVKDLVTDKLDYSYTDKVSQQCSQINRLWKREKMFRYTVTLVTDYTTLITTVDSNTTDFNKVVQLAIQGIKDNDGLDLTDREFGDFADVLIEKVLIENQIQ